MFGLIWAMTRGGPGNKSQTLPLFMYEQAFQLSQIGYGTAIALRAAGWSARCSRWSTCVLTAEVDEVVHASAPSHPPSATLQAPTPSSGRRPSPDVALLLLASPAFVLPLLWLVLASFDRTRRPAGDVAARVRRSANFNAVLTTDTTYRPMLNGLRAVRRAAPADGGVRGAGGVPAVALPARGSTGRSC